MPGMTSVADSGHSADVDPRRPTSSLLKGTICPRKPVVFHQPLSTLWRQPYLDTGSANRML
jgi:hypothetical protein